MPTDFMPSFCSQDIYVYVFIGRGYVHMSSHLAVFDGVYFPWWAVLKGGTFDNRGSPVNQQLLN